MYSETGPVRPEPTPEIAPGKAHRSGNIRARAQITERRFSDFVPLAIENSASEETAHVKLLKSESLTCTLSRKWAKTALNAFSCSIANSRASSSGVRNGCSAGRESFEAESERLSFIYHCDVGIVPNNQRPPGNDSFIVVEYAICNSCGGEVRLLPSMKVELIHIESSATGWKAKGTVARCSSCGMVLPVLRKEIPIVASEFKCPICQGSEHLEYRISSITKDVKRDYEYEFEAVIFCKRCTRKRTLRAFANSLSEVSKIKVAPGGIDFGQI